MVHLQTLQSVLVTGSLSAAAKELGYTTSAVSQQVAGLERALDVTLFERGPRSLRPTPAAVQMGRHADELLRRLSMAEQDMRGFSAGARGGLRIAAFPTVGAQILPRALSRLVLRHPGATFTVHDDHMLDNVVAAVHDGRADLGFVFEYETVRVQWPTGLHTPVVLDEELVVIHGRGHPSTTEPIGGFDELAGDIWVTNRSDTAAYDNLFALCAGAGFEPDVRYQSNDYDVVRGIVRESLGVALVPALALGTDRGITMRRFTGDAPCRRIRAVHRASDPNPFVPIALEAVQHAAREFLRWTDGAFAVRLESPLGVVPGHEKLEAG